MNGEKPKTVREEWIDFSRDVQTDVDNTLDLLQIEIDVYNQRLAIAAREELHNLDGIIQDMIEYFDSQWGYMGDYFMVTGKWYQVDEMAVGQAGFWMKHQLHDAFNVAVSNGFQVCVVGNKENQPPEIVLSFNLGDQFLTTAQFQGRIELLAYAKPSDISLQFLRPASSESVGASIEEVSQAIENAEAVLLAHLNHPQSSFYNASAIKQGNFLRSVTEYASCSLPPVESLDRVTVRDLAPALFYIKDITDGEVYCIENNDEDEQLVIDHGVILGFTTVDLQRDGIGKIKYSSPGQMNAYYNGLCAIVMPLECNFDLSQYNNPDLVIPLRKIAGKTTLYLESPDV